MTNEVKVAITNAVYEVYAHTTEPYQSSACVRRVAFSAPTELGDYDTFIRITRAHGTSRGLVYELYVRSDKDPFVTVFGCWPIGFVADVFIRALEHYHNWY